MKQCNNITMKKGLTLLEVIIAIFLITVGVLGALALITRTISITGISSQKLIASYLAQEGIEIVRNIRDGNWLEQRTNPAIPWDDGLGIGDWEADYITQTLTDIYDGDFLKIDGGFYNYTLGTNTKFKRKITIFDKTDLDGDMIIDMFKVSVLVEWQEKGETHSVPAQENLYNWR